MSIQLIISGNVQGVGLRYATRREAQRSGLVGWVKNNPDGTVSAYVQGTESAVEQFLRWLKVGGFSRFITHIATIEQPPDPSLDLFEVRY